MPTSTSFAALSGHEFMNLTTYRKSGEAMVTPVWFAQDGDTLYVMTSKDAGKVKRIRNTARVQIGPSDRSGKPLGPVELAQGRVLAGQEAKKADELLSKKYGLMKKMFDLAGSLRGGRDFLAITQAPEVQE
ncbi:MAG: PPOX class F420-dependent oxidoreductase [Roseiflexaceae bacterium]|nr:PPOX class F420-dependent oxidoreductase [Roseiflexaceae bacterium]